MIVELELLWNVLSDQLKIHFICITIRVHCKQYLNYVNIMYIFFTVFSFIILDVTLNTYM